MAKPSEWTENYIPTLQEWKDAFAADGLVVSVTDHGAVSDNAVTDNTAAFKRALQAVMASPTGGVLALPAGRFAVSEALTIFLTGNQAFKLRGEGRDVSEIVWIKPSDGLRVTISGPSDWLRTAASPAPVFHYEGVSLVQAGAGISGAALTITGATTSHGFSPRVKIQDIGIHGTVNGQQGWYDGIVYTNMPSGLTLDDGYIVFANLTPPYTQVGRGLAIAGGPVNPATGRSSLISSLYYITNLTVQNAAIGVEIGQGVQGVYMDRVGGNANQFIRAYQPTNNGDTSSIKLSNSNPTGYDHSVYIENIDYVWLVDNQFQPFGSRGYIAAHLVKSGFLVITGNTIVGDLNGGARAQQGFFWDGIFVDYPAVDTVGAYNEKLIAHNHIALMRLGILCSATTKNVLVLGNMLSNNTLDYDIGADGFASSNMRNGQLELYNSGGHPAVVNYGLLVNGPATVGAMEIIDAMTAAKVTVAGPIVGASYSGTLNSPVLLQNGAIIQGGPVSYVLQNNGDNELLLVGTGGNKIAFRIIGGVIIPGMANAPDGLKTGTLYRVGNDVKIV